MNTQWQQIFPDFKPEVTATQDDLEQLRADMSRPVQASERQDIEALQRNPWPKNHSLHSTWTPIDPTHWPMPAVALPPSWLAFLAWSNGGLVTNGAMELCFFSTREVREFLLAYHLPEYMPQAIPLGVDGAGNFALLDVRQPMTNNDYPIVAAAAGNLGFEDASLIAPSLELFCLRTKSIESVLFE